MGRSQRHEMKIKEYTIHASQRSIFKEEVTVSYVVERSGKIEKTPVTKIRLERGEKRTGGN